MKKLIIITIITLFPLITWGQYRITTNVLQFVHDYTEVSFKPLLLQTLKEYQKECNSDSSLFVVKHLRYIFHASTGERLLLTSKYSRSNIFVYIDKNKFKACECCEESDYNVWLKPEPTFEGFIKWLEEVE